MGTGTNDTHFSCEHVKELGELVNIESAKQPAYTGYAFIIIIRRPLICFTIANHRTELQAHKILAMTSNSFLTEKNGPFRIEPDKQCYQWCEPAHQRYYHERREYNVEASFD